MQAAHVTAWLLETTLITNCDYIDHVISEVRTCMYTYNLVFHSK